MIMKANLILKTTLDGFWRRFGGRKSTGVGFNPLQKLEALQLLSTLVIPYKSQTGLSKRRDSFNESKFKLHPWRRFGTCFVCADKANVRHHIVQLQNGGINSKKNLVSLCDQCHAKIHPWL